MTGKRKKIDWGDVWDRTWKTFIQGFFGSGVVLTPAMIVNAKDAKDLWVSVICPVLIGGVAGGICALWNTARDYFSKKKEK